MHIMAIMTVRPLRKERGIMPESRLRAEEDTLFLLLELNDALFPIGAYAHSYGLETYVQQGCVHDAATAGKWLRAYFSGSFLYGELLSARLAYEALGERDGLEKLLELEAEVRAARVPRETRAALQKLGRRLAKNVTKIGLPFAARFDDYVKAAEQSCSHPVCYGALAAALALPERTALQHYLYAQLSALTNTCVKLIPLSQTDGARLVASFRTCYSAYIDRALAAEADDLCLSSPGLDIRAMQHEVLYSRLYMS